MYIIILVLFSLFIFFQKKPDKKIVLFHRPDCGYCRKLKPEWAKFEKMSSIETQQIDINDHKDLADKYNIQGVPTIILFKGETSIEYKGERTAESLLKFINL
jgi:protein disulfide-isomerase A1